MEAPLARWMFVTDAVRGYVMRRGVQNITARGRADLIKAIAAEAGSMKAALGTLPVGKHPEIQAEITGALNFLHALRQAHEGLPPTP